MGLVTVLGIAADLNERRLSQKSSSRHGFLHEITPLGSANPVYRDGAGVALDSDLAGNSFTGKGTSFTSKRGSSGVAFTLLRFTGPLKVRSGEPERSTLRLLASRGGALCGCSGAIG